MSAAARPKRWGVSSSERSRNRSHQGRTFHPIDLTGRPIRGTWGKLGGQKEKEMISINGLDSGTCAGWIRICPNHCRENKPYLTYTKGAANLGSKWHLHSMRPAL
jgi:hypothetical protein